MIMLSQRYHKTAILLLGVACLAVATKLFAEDIWHHQLKQGNPVQVDLYTNKATITDDQGAITPLWDGVHSLSDGTTLTVREGIAVPTPAIIEQQQSLQLPKKTQQDLMALPACLVLVRKTCGMDDQCMNSEACSLATQLFDFEQEEIMERINHGRLQPLTLPEQCRQALDDETLFTPCR